MNSKIFITIALLASSLTMAAATQTPTYNEITLPGSVSTGYFRGSIVYADINCDGYMDLLVKGRDLNNSWTPEVIAITTDSDYVFSDKINLTSSTPYESTLIAFDFNNDTYVDYLLTSYGYELYKNNGDGSFTKMDNFALSSNITIGDDNGTAELWYMGITIAADFNLDGYQDLVVMDSNGNPALYLNNGGDGSFTLSEDAGLYAQRNGTMSVGDFNKDGYPDLVVSGWSDTVSNDCIIINKNNGDGTFTTVSPSVLVGTEKGQIMFVDIDSDGYLDIFVTGQSGVENWNNIAYIFRNNCDETFTKVSTSLTGACKSGCDWADLNGDGLIDIVYGGETSNDSKAVVVINEGNLSFTGTEGLLCRARGGVAVSAYDINRNGFPNVAIMGYNDDGAPHFHVYNGLCSRNSNTEPTAPSDLAMTNNGNSVTFSWGAGSDSRTATDALRYNVYVKLNDGSIITLVPANPETGVLHIGDVNAAITTCSYTLNIDYNEIQEWGVQTIDGGKYASAFTKYEVSGISSIASSDDIVDIKCAEGRISVNVDAKVAVYDLSGKALIDVTTLAEENLSTELPTGIYIVKAITGNGVAVKKIFIQ